MADLYINKVMTMLHNRVTDTRSTNQLVNLIIGCSIFLILYTTLFPFDFIARNQSLLAEIGSRFDLTLLKLRTPVDLVRNILLFVPVGFALIYLLPKKQLGVIRPLFITLIIGVALSFSVELLQVFLPERDPSISDLLTNSLGVFLGYAAAYRWGDCILDYFSIWIEKIKNLLSPRMLVGFFIGYATLFLLLSMWLQSMATLTNWEPDFPLMLGNERTGDRPWQGRISELTIFNRAFSETEVSQLFSEKEATLLAKDSIVAAYRFNPHTNYQDQVGLSPDLTWQATTSSVQDEASVSLGPKHWLVTTGPVTLLNRKIRESSQFTLDVVVASAGKAQDGPARIISISGNPFQRNLTLGQENTDLVVRLRTPFTGENGREPELVVPDIFDDSSLHHLITTYDGVSLQVYVDGVARSYLFQFSPEVIFFQYFLPVSEWRIYLNSTVMWFYALFYYSLVFVPQGMLLGMIATSLKRNPTARVLLFGGGISLPTFLLESSLAYMTGNMIRAENIFLGLILAAIATYASAAHVNNLAHERPITL